MSTGPDGSIEELRVLREDLEGHAWDIRDYLSGLRETLNDRTLPPDEREKLEKIEVVNEELLDEVEYEIEENRNLEAQLQTRLQTDARRSRMSRFLGGTILGLLLGR